ncbi:MAG: trypsin-like peptidase domain-containing protein [Thermodesulfobacteriota bacterium]
MLLKHRIAACLLLIFSLSVSCFYVTPSLAYSPKQIYQKAGPGVVFIFASQGSRKGSGGTGSIISQDGLVITNAHIFKPKGTTELLTDISIFLKPERVTGNHKTDLAQGYKGNILAYDLPLDLALVKIVGARTPLPMVAFADSELVDIGEQVYAIGHPEQGGLWSLTTGVVSAYWSDYGGIVGKNLFQTDASINRGNSGGPLLDDTGDMIGINSMIARKAADGLTITDVNFSIRSSVAIDWLGGKGYRFAAVKKKPVASPQPAEAAPPIIEKKAEKKVAAPAEEEEKTAPPPSKPAADKKQAETVSEETPDKVEEPADLLKEEMEDPSPGKDEPADDMIAQKPEKEKILTEKKPYRMDDLLEGMREMEDMMDEMKDMMDDFKKRRKK